LTEQFNFDCFMIQWRNISVMFLVLHAVENKEIRSKGSGLSDERNYLQKFLLLVVLFVQVYRVPNANTLCITTMRTCAVMFWS